MKKSIYKKISIIIASALMAVGMYGTISMAALEDGTYKVPVQMKKAVEDADSMGAGALESEALVDVKSGKPEVTLYFKGISFMNMYGHIEKLYTYAEGTDLTSTSKTPVEATVHETFEDEGLEGGKMTFPRAFRFSRENTEEKFIPIRVRTDAMAKIASDGMGEQDARIIINYDAAKKTEDTSAPKAETKNEKSSDAKTNTKTKTNTNTNTNTGTSSGAKSSSTGSSGSSSSSSSTPAKSSSSTAKSPENLPKTGSDINTKNVIILSSSVILAGILLRKKFR